MRRFDKLCRLRETSDRKQCWRQARGPQFILRACPALTNYQRE